MTDVEKYQKLKDILVLDIETVSQYQNFSDIPERLKQLWQKKADRLNKEEIPEEEYYFKRAGIYAEFGKVIAISLGFFHLHESQLTFRVKGLHNDDERELLKEFNELTTEKMDAGRLRLLAHNGKEFDFPYLSRRMIINGLPLPYFLDNAGKKPWEVPHLDTLELWKFGDYKSYTALDLLTAVLEVPSPKQDIDGSQVNATYYKEKDLERISRYCSNDVVATAQVFLRLKGMPLLNDDKVVIS